MFFLTVALLVITMYFLLGGLPLLILKHDVPLDARFIRGFFNVCYKAALCAALGASVSFALWGRPGFAVGAAALAAIAILLRRHLLPLMQQLGTQIEANSDGAVQRFRRAHAAAYSSTSRSWSCWSGAPSSSHGRCDRACGRRCALYR